VVAHGVAEDLVDVADFDALQLTHVDADASIVAVIGEDAAERLAKVLALRDVPHLELGVSVVTGGGQQPGGELEGALVDVDDVREPDGLGVVEALDVRVEGEEAPRLVAVTRGQLDEVAGGLAECGLEPGRSQLELELGWRDYDRVGSGGAGGSEGENEQAGGGLHLHRMAENRRAK